MLNGFHSPTKFVSLRQIHRCCGNLCSTKDRQGPERALWAEIAGNDDSVLRSLTEAGSQLWKQGTGAWKWWTIGHGPQ